MAYKTLLTILSKPARAAETLESAARVALQMDAHLDVLCLGLDRTQVGLAYSAGSAAVLYHETLSRAQDEAAATEAAARAWLEGRQTLRWAVDTNVAHLGALADIAGLRARYSDLVVLPRPYGNDRGPEDEAAIEAALFAGRAPVLVIPDGGLAQNFGRQIVIAWNQSAEAMVAVRRALPLLCDAERVHIAIIDPSTRGAEASEPGAGLCRLLSRHGVRAEVAVLARTLPRVSDMICRHAREVGADMVVMGAYGHSRFREAILGGTTRNMLQMATLPVFMAH